MTISGRCAFKIPLRFLAVDCNTENLIPVHILTRHRHLTVALPCVGDSLCNVRGVRRDQACDDSLFHIVQIRQAQVFRRSYITEKISTRAGGDRPPIAAVMWS